MKGSFLFRVFAPGVLILPGLCLMADNGAVSLSGIIKNDGNKPLPGVAVKINQRVTHTEQETITDTAGNYSLENLPPGQYHLEVNLVGYQPITKEINLNSKDFKMNFVLTPSSSGSAQKGAGRGQPPRRGRFQTLTLQGPDGMDASKGGFPDVVFAPGQSNGAPTGAAAEGRKDETLVIQGSISQTSQFSPFAPGAKPTDDQTQEIRDRKRERRAAGGMGGPGGGPMGGGPGGGFGGNNPNRLRGSLYENYSNSVFDARQYSFSGLEQPKGSYNSNNFGANLGGPFSIPKIYNGKDRSSFFVSYQGSRNRSPADTTVTVPTEQERNGDFSQSLVRIGATTQPVAIYDPAIQGGSGQDRQFSNNIIPANRISSTARGLMDYIPLPNLPGDTLNYRLLQSLPSNSDMILTRFNFRLTSKDNLAVAYTWRQGVLERSQYFPGFLTTQGTRGQNARLSLTHNFTSHLISTTTYSFNRMRTNSLNEFAYVNNVEGELGITGVSPEPANYGVPTIRLTNFSGLQDTNALLSRNQTSHIASNLTWVKNKHTFKGGIEYRRLQLNNNSDPNARGTFVFNGSLTSALSPAGTIIHGTGYDLADFLLGLPQSTSIRYGTSSTYFRGNVYNLFVMDNWKITPQLTLNLGLRYELVTPLTEKQNHIANLDVAPDFTGVSVVTPGAIGPYTGAFPRGLIDPDRNNFAPRIGIAWKPFQHHSTVVRSGYGISYNPSIYNTLFSQLASQPPFAYSSTLITSPTQVLTLNDGFPAAIPGTVTNNYAVDRSLRVAYIQLWNLDIQHKIRPNLSLDLSYNGSKGTHLNLFLSPNRTLISPQNPSVGQDISNAQAFFYETYGADSSFNSFTVRLQRSFTSGLSVNGSYIYGKSIDNAPSIGGGQQTVALYENDLAAERGLSTFDIRHQAEIMTVYELPMGERKRFFSGGGLPSKLAGGWSLMAMITLQSGTPYTARITGSSTFTQGITTNSSLRANSTGLPVSLPSGESSVGHFFNTDAFALPAPGFLGNAGRNTITGPGFTNVDMTVTKEIPLSNDGKRLEFRAQATNLLNTVNFSGLGTVVDSSTFGQLTSAMQMRQLQFTLKFSF